MTKKETFKRWHDEDPVVAKCVSLLENIDDNVKRQVSTFILSEIIEKPQYKKLVPEEVFEMATGETKRRRWYDEDEIVRIFVELLKNSEPKLRKEMAVMAVTFMEDVIND